MAAAAAGVGALTAPLRARSQPASRLKLVALLVEGPAFKGPSPDVAAEQKRLGWIEGENVRYERRGAQRPEELPIIAAELVALQPDLIVTYGTPAALAVKRATQTIPIMFNVGADPVASGLVASLARPGGNLTGFYEGNYDAKKLQLVKEILPRTAFVVFPQKIDSSISDAAQKLGVRVQGINVATEQDLDRFFVELRGLRADAVVLSPASWVRPPSAARIAQEFLSMKMPAVGSGRSFTNAGGLMTFGPVYSALRGVGQADQILKGANPADMPVELPTNFDLVLNLRTAKLFGIAVPKTLRLQADQVIE